jgi:2-polyprenyl-3-methyl-5-hydroxy-6-metoxy-1,4-benzoquinol methylase
MISAELSSSAAVATDCIVCGAALNSLHLRVGDVQLFRCPDCATWTSHPRIGAVEQAAIHDSDAYFDHPYFAGRRGLTLRARQRCRDVFRRLSAAVDLPSLSGQRLLDVGCDTGLFLECAREQFGIVPVGVDVAERSVRVAAVAAIEVHRSTLEDAPTDLQGFRAITAIDILEHVTDPLGFLCAARNRLAPGGALYLETPNIRSAVYVVGRVLARLLSGRPTWMFERLFPRQHIQYFTAKSLALLANKTGLEVVRIGTRVLPWPDISASLVVRAGVSLLQIADRFTRSEALIWAVLRRPVSQDPETACR